MNEFAVTLTLIEMIQYGATIFTSGVAAGYLIGFLVGKYLCKKEIKTSVLYDTCQVPLINEVKDDFHVIQKFIINDECKYIVCDFLEDKTTCTLNKRKIKRNRGRCNYL